MPASAQATSKRSSSSSSKRSSKRLTKAIADASTKQTARQGATVDVPVAAPKLTTLQRNQLTETNKRLAVASGDASLTIASNMIVELRTPLRFGRGKFAVEKDCLHALMTIAVTWNQYRPDTQAAIIVALRAIRNAVKDSDRAFAYRRLAIAHNSDDRVTDVTRKHEEKMINVVESINDRMDADSFKALKSVVAPLAQYIAGLVAAIANSSNTDSILIRDQHSGGVTLSLEIVQNTIVVTSPQFVQTLTFAIDSDQRKVASALINALKRAGYQAPKA